MLHQRATGFTAYRKFGQIIEMRKQELDRERIVVYKC